MDEPGTIRVSQHEDGTITVRHWLSYLPLRMTRETAEDVALAILQLTRPEAFTE